MKISNRIKNNNKGFVILFAVTIASILLAIAIGVANIALKEIKFGTNAKDTNEAFFAADTGTEFALNNDKSTSSSYAPGSFTPFSVFQLGSTGQSCVYVTVDKTNSVMTTVIAKGYNTGDNISGICTPRANSVERELETTYGATMAVQNVVWGNLVGNVCSGSGCSPTINSNSIKAVSASGWTAGATANKNIASSDGYIESTALLADMSTTRAFGLNPTIFSNGNWTLKYSWYFDGCCNAATIKENGSIPGPAGATYSAGDTFRIAIESGGTIVNYYKNSTSIYSHTITPSYPLYFDAALNATGSAISNAVIAGYDLQ